MNVGTSLGHHDVTAPLRQGGASDGCTTLFSAWRKGPTGLIFAEMTLHHRATRRQDMKGATHEANAEASLTSPDPWRTVRGIRGGRAGEPVRFPSPSVLLA